VSICRDCLGRINFIDTPFFNPDIDDCYFRTARSVASYESVWRDVIHDFKFNNRPELAALLARHLAKLVNFEYDAVLPVPMSGKRLRERGYNHSALLAKELSGLLGFPCRFFGLERIKDTKAQVGLSRRLRFQNVKGSFAVPKREFVEGADILLVDDVMTTGATVNECAKELKKAGASGVDVVTLARAL